MLSLPGGPARLRQGYGGSAVVSTEAERSASTTRADMKVGPYEDQSQITNHKSRMLHDDLHPLPAVGPEQADRGFQFGERHHIADERLHLHLASLDERDRCGVVLGLGDARADERD